jgi:hypothetical protein
MFALGPGPSSLIEPRAHCGDASEGGSTGELVQARLEEGDGRLDLILGL